MRPPSRFQDVRLSTYRPDPAHPSQAMALDAMRTFSRHIDTPPEPRRLWRRKRPAARKLPALYLDGGFGVGKTHLLAGLWHESTDPKAYVTFAELTAFIGFAGMDSAIAALRNQRVLCIDEFELDDVANTLMVVSLLRGVMENGLKLAVTSNTLPDQLGEQRFSASEFRREIAAIASFFDEIRIDGPDFRATSAPLPLARLTAVDLDFCSDDEFDSVLTHLRVVHPVQYGPLLDGLHGVRIRNSEPIEDQDRALLFVALVDKLYDARIPVLVTGCPVGDVFASSYRAGGYRKKYARAESRLRAMRRESEGHFPDAPG